MSSTSNSVPEILLIPQTQEVDVSPVESIYKDTFNNLVDVNKLPENILSNYSIATIENSLRNNLQDNSDKNEFTAAVQTDLPSCIETANGLKNYATVNTAEPITTQVSYNIGTENIENGKDGETLNNTEMELGENSIISEIENVGIDLYDTNLNRSDSIPCFDVDMFDTSNVAVNSTPITQQNKGDVIAQISSVHNKTNNEINTMPNEINLDNFAGLSKQIYMPEALQMSLACEEENPSTWIDAINLLNTQSIYVYEQPSTDIPSMAVPTAVPTLINIETEGNNILDDLTNNNNVQANVSNDNQLLMYNNANLEAPQKINSLTVETSNSSNVLKNVTTETDNCNCKSCNCEETSICGKKKEKFEKKQKKCCDKGAPACSSTDVGNNINNCNENEECCIVVCIKSLDQLKQMLALTQCSGFQSLNVTCVKNNVCGQKK